MFPEVIEEHSYIVYTDHDTFINFRKVISVSIYIFNQSCFVLVLVTVINFIVGPNGLCIRLTKGIVILFRLP